MSRDPEGLQSQPADDLRRAEWDELWDQAPEAFERLTTGNSRPEDVPILKRLVVRGLTRGLWQAQNWKLWLEHRGYL